MKLKIYNLLKPLGTIIQQNYWSFYPSELIYFAFFTMRHPVFWMEVQLNDSSSKSAQIWLSKSIFQTFLIFFQFKTIFYRTQNINTQKAKPLNPYPQYLFGVGIWIWAKKNYGFSLPWFRSTFFVIIIFW